TIAVDVAMPGMGSFFGMLIGQIIPNQRNERLVEYVTRLSRRLAVVEGQFRQASAADLEQSPADAAEAYAKIASPLGPEQLALFEDGAYAAARATSPERNERISSDV